MNAPDRLAALRNKEARAALHGMSYVDICETFDFDEAEQAAWQDGYDHPPQEMVAAHAEWHEAMRRTRPARSLARQRGIIARLQRRGRDACPYDDELRAAWLDGFDCAPHAASWHRARLSQLHKAGWDQAQAWLRRDPPANLDEMDRDVWLTGYDQMVAAAREQLGLDLVETEEGMTVIPMRPRGNSAAGDPVTDDTIINYQRASEISMQRVEWIWQGRLARGKVTLLAGDPGFSKSTISLDIAARITRNRRAVEPNGKTH